MTANAIRALRLALLAVGTALAAATQPGRELVEKKLTELKGEGRQVIPVADDAAARAFPGYSFYLCECASGSTRSP